MTWDRGSTRRDDHTKGRTRFLETPAEHEAVARFEKVEEGGHAGEREMTDKDGGIQAGVAFFVAECFTAGSISVWKGSEDWRKR